MKERAIQVGKSLFLILGIGIGYAIWIKETNLGIPCMFHTITGLRCPGCGMIHMCMCILQGDFRTAMKYNVMLFALLPLLGVILTDYLLRYILTGEWKVLKWETVVLYIIIGLMIIFAILRNIYGF